MNQQNKPFSWTTLPLPFEAVSNKWGWLLIIGLLQIIIGLVAVVAPIAATEVSEIFLGWLLLLGGILQLLQAFRVSAWKGALWQMLGAVLFLLAGLFMVLKPIDGAIALTFVLAVFFMAEGASRCIIAFRVRPMQGWYLFLFGGLMGFLLGVLLWLEWPASGLWAIGLLLGVNLIVSGLSLTSLSCMLRRGLSAK